MRYKCLFSVWRILKSDFTLKQLFQFSFNNSCCHCDGSNMSFLKLPSYFTLPDVQIATSNFRYINNSYNRIGNLLPVLESSCFNLFHFISSNDWQEIFNKLISFSATSSFQITVQLILFTSCL